MIVPRKRTVNTREASKVIDGLAKLFAKSMRTPILRRLA
jgi:hypothetical protein